MSRIDEKKVSIVLPVYNGEKYISESIGSVLNQTYSNWELIIINDCSTDNTLDIVNKYAGSDSRINVFTNDRNLKLPKSLNAGFSHAKGEYYTWTSDDNIFRENAIQTMVEYLDRENDTDMVYCDYSLISSDGEIKSRLNLMDPKYLLIGNIIGACFMYRRSIADSIGEYDTNLFLAEDYDYWVRIFLNGKLKHINSDLYLYREHEGSLTETKKKYVNEQTYKALEKSFLPLYNRAIDEGLVNGLFDHIMSRAEEHSEQTFRMLIKINKKYRYYCMKKKLKERKQ